MTTPRTSRTKKSRSSGEHPELEAETGGVTELANGPPNGPNGGPTEEPNGGWTAAQALGPEADLIARQDPLSVGPILMRLGAAMATNPMGVWEAGMRFAGRLSGAAAGMAARALGAKPKPALLPAPKDRRFRDPAWDENPWFFGERQAYLAWAHLVNELVTAGGLDKHSEDKAAFALGLLVDAMAPTNFLMTNPAALRKAAETHGMSIVRGLKNFVDDVVHNGGWPRQVDASSFEVGRNLAATPGKVVRSEEHTSEL